MSVKPLHVSYGRLSRALGLIGVVGIEACADCFLFGNFGLVVLLDAPFLVQCAF